MNENPILPARIIIFFPPLLYPKIFPPPTYLLPPPSYLPPTNPSPPHSIARAPETLSGNKLGAGASRGASSSRAVEAGARPTWEQERDSGKHLTFLLLVSFLVSSSCCGVALQLHKGDSSIAAVTFFFLFFCCAALCLFFLFFLIAMCFSLQRCKEGDGSNAIAFFVFCCAVVGQQRRRR